MKWCCAIMTIGGLSVFLAIVAYAQKPAETATQIHATMRPEPLRTLARLAASYELAKIHTRELETVQGMRAVWNDVFDQLLPATDVDARWKARIVRPSAISKDRANQAAGEKQDDTALTEFEKRGAEKIKQGADEVLERPAPGNVLYLRSIRVEKSCVAFCHADSPWPGGVFMQAGSNKVDGTVISLQITWGKQEPDKK